MQKRGFVRLSAEETNRRADERFAAFLRRCQSRQRAKYFKNGSELVRSSDYVQNLHNKKAPKAMTMDEFHDRFRPGDKLVDGFLFRPSEISDRTWVRCFFCSVPMRSTEVGFMSSPCDNAFHHCYHNECHHRLISRKCGQG